MIATAKLEKRTETVRPTTDGTTEMPDDEGENSLTARKAIGVSAVAKPL